MILVFVLGYLGNYCYYVFDNKLLFFGFKLFYNLLELNVVLNLNLMFV